MKIIFLFLDRIISDDNDDNDDNDDYDEEKFQISAPFNSNKLTNSNGSSDLHQNNPFSSPLSYSSSSDQFSSSTNSKDFVFGAPLENALFNSFGQKVYVVPPIISDCVNQILKRGLEEEGIFRISGSLTTIKNYREAYDLHQKVDLSKDFDIHNIAGILKMYLREMPENIFTNETLPKLLIQVASKNSDQTFLKILCCIPEVNLNSLKQILYMLYQVLSKSHINRMSLSNLSIIFTQVLKINSNFFEYLMLSNGIKSFCQF